jgi:hypothetical protein
VRGHVDAETLAAFGEELLPRRKAGRVAAHLAECPRCAGLDAQLAGLPALLAHAPAPPMPDALTTRIEAALAAEAAARPARAAAGVPGTEGATGVSAPSARPHDAAGAARGRPWRRAAAPGRSRLALRVAVAAAAVVVVVAGGGYGVSRLFSGGPPVTGASSVAGPAVNGRAAASARNRVPGALPAGQAHSGAASAGSKDHAAFAGPAGYLVVASGTNYRAGLLRTQVRATLIRFRPTAAGPGAIASPAPRFAPASSCLAGVTGGQRPRLVDVAHYEGRPATVVVVPAGARTLRALVFAGRCPAAAAGPLTSTALASPG